MRKILDLLETSWVKDLLEAGRLALAVGLLVAVYSMFMPLYFRSEAKLLPFDNKSAGSLGGIAATAAALGLGAPGQDGPEATYPDILASRWMCLGLLDSRYTYTMRGIPLFQRKWQETKTLREYLAAPNEDQAVRELGDLLTVQRDIKTRSLTLAAETRSPELSRQVVNRALELLGQFLLEKNQTRGKTKVSFILARLDEAKRELTAKEASFRAFLEVNRNFAVSADPGIRLGGARLEADLQLQRQVLTTLALNKEQAMLEEKNDMPLLNILDAGYTPIERSRPARARLVITGFLVAFAGILGWRRRVWIQQGLAASLH